MWDRAARAADAFLNGGKWYDDLGTQQAAGHPLPYAFMQTIGKHQVEIEADTLLVRWVGATSLADMQAVGALHEQLIAAHGRSFYIMDMRKAGLPTPEARLYLRDWAVGKPIIGPVVFGMSLPVRTIVTLLLRGMELRHQYKRFETAVVKDEVEARSWVVQVRQRRDAEKSSTE